MRRSIQHTRFSKQSNKAFELDEVTSLAAGHTCAKPGTAYWLDANQIGNKNLRPWTLNT
jgi:hypothetical protein